MMPANLNKSAIDDSVDQIEAGIYNRLDRLNIHYETFTHKPVATVAEAVEVAPNIPGMHVKNLFLRDKKKNYFLITAYYQTAIDLKAARFNIGASGNLSFGSADALWEILRVRPGSVNPFAMLYACGKNIRFFLDKKLADSEHINLHPMRNDKSLTLKSADLIKFIESTEHRLHLLTL